jgi:DNA ligase (NAD+)
MRNKWSLYYFRKEGDKKMDKINRIKELVKQLNEACDAYYVNDKPIMSDKQYDILYDELTALQTETNYILSSSPTEKVQGKILDSLKKVQHTEPMLSAEKSKNINDVIKFMGNQECILSWKLDGLTLVLRYNNGKLQQAITRGGGDFGEDVTEAVKTFSNIPLTISYPNYLEIRGEGLVEFKEFERINTELIDRCEDTYSSPRNLAAGSVRQLDSNITKKRNLIFIAFGIVKCEAVLWNSKYAQFAWLEDHGFEVVYHETVRKDNLEKWVNIFKDKIPNLSFLTDGLIIEFDDTAYGKAQGFTGHHTKNMFALKWQDDSSETKFRGVELNTTRTGMVSITGLFDEVEIDGVKVSRASLHNYDIFETLQLGVGDILSVYRANAVIPQVEENLTRSGTYKINMICPSCGGDIAIRAPKVARFLFCENEKCSSKLVNRFIHLCSKDALNVDGLSEAGIELFIQKGFLKKFDDLYNLNQYKKQIIQLEGWGTRSYNKLQEAIEKSRKVKMSNFLYALGIPNIGVNGSKIISKNFNNNFNSFTFACEKNYDFSMLEDFGNITNQSIHNWFDNENERRIWIGLMAEVEFIKEEKKEEIGMNSLEGKIFVVTGKVDTFKNRDEVGELITSLGGKLSGSVSKNTSYLLNNDITSITGKNKKALELGIPIISEIDFNLMIGRM